MTDKILYQAMSDMNEFVTPIHGFPKMQKNNTENFKKYARTQISEMTKWTSGIDMNGVSISDFDLANGSPKEGDMIARNPNNHLDRWLVANEYFLSNFIEM